MKRSVLVAAPMFFFIGKSPLTESAALSVYGHALSIWKKNLFGARALRVFLATRKSLPKKPKISFFYLAHKFRKNRNKKT